MPVTHPTEDDNDTGTSASSLGAEFREGEFQMNPTDRRKRDRLLRRAQKNAHVAKHMAPKTTAPQQQKKKARRKTQKVIKDAIALKPAAGKSYAEVLAEVRQTVRLEELGATIKNIRKTRGGEALLEVVGETESKKKLTEAFETAIGDAGIVS